MNKGIVFMGMGFELVGLVIAAILIGTKVEKFFQWPAGYGVGALIILLMAGWFIHLILLMRRYLEEDENDKTGPDSSSQ